MATAPCAADVCEGGQCSPELMIGINPMAVAGLAVSEGRVCFTSEATASGPTRTTMVCAPACGGTPVTVVSRPGGTSPRLLFARGELIWSTSQLYGVGGSFLRFWRTDLTAQSTTNLMDAPTGPFVGSMARHDNALLYAITSSQYPEQNGIYELPFTGGVGTRLFALRVSPMANAMQISKDTLVFASDSRGAGIYTTALPPKGAPSLLARIDFLAGGLAVRGDRVYWTDTVSFATSREGTLWSARLDGSEKVALLRRPGNLLEVVVDDTDAFVTFADPVEHGEGIVRVPLAGGPATDIVSGVNRATKLAADEVNLFWLGDDGVYRLRKRQPAPL